MPSAIPLAFATVLALATLSARAAAQQDPVMGSVTIAGPADSLFRAFKTHLAKGNFKIERIDAPGRTIRFVAPESKTEAVVVRFAARGDSTLISAQGVRGGMMATMTGLMAVHAMVSPTDSVNTPGAPRPPQRPPR
jgi:fructose-specific phosphotransferase system IIC component